MEDILPESLAWYVHHKVLRRTLHLCFVVFVFALSLLVSREVTRAFLVRSMHLWCGRLRQRGVRVGDRVVAINSSKFDEHGSTNVQDYLRGLAAQRVAKTFSVQKMLSQGDKEVGSRERYPERQRACL